MHLNIENIRQACSQYGGFAHSYWWLVRFNQLTAADILCHQVTEPLRGVDLGEVDYGGTSIAYPERSTTDNISMSFYETGNWDFIQSVKRWYGQIVSSQYLVQLIKQAAKPMSIIHLDGSGSVVWQNEYYVLPEGSPTWDLSSDKGGLIEHSFTFKIVGDAE